MVRARPVSGPRAARPLARLLAAAGLLLAAACSPEPPDPAESPPDPAPPEPADPAPEVEPEPPGDPEPPEAEPEPALGAYGVSAGDAHAVDAGMQILEAGGSAVDAAVAAAFAVAVVEPFASGIGGGGAAIVAAPREEPVAYDYREVVASDGRIPPTNTGIPGFVAGMAELHEAHGELSFSELLEPATVLAHDGVGASATVADQLRSAAHRLPTTQLPHLYPGGAALAAGAPLVQEELADTLRTLADDGPHVFYEGELADDLAAAVDGIDTTSLAGYEVQRSVPPSGSFAGHEVVAAAPPLPGVTLIQMLQVAEALGIDEHPPGSADHVHAIAMSWRLADQFVSWDLGDPDFVDVPVEELTDATRNAELAAGIPMDGLLPVDPGAPRGGLAGNTTHLTVVDADGMMVSMTNTLTNFWGSGQYVRGFFLNDQLRRFAIGRGDANVAEPGRRSVSWSLPAMVLDADGRPVLGIGSPGGRRIPMILTQLLVRWGVHGQSLEEAVAAPRFHLEGADLELEQLPPDEVAGELRGRGYASLSVPPLPFYFGSVQALEADHEDGEVLGAADRRREAAWDAARP